MNSLMDQLSSSYRDHPLVLIAEVECQLQSEQLCKQHEVTTYPQFKYGPPDNLRLYEGSHRYDDVKQFVHDHLGSSCHPMAPALCSKKEKRELDRLLNLHLDELLAEIAAKDKEIAQVEAEFAPHFERAERQLATVAVTREKEVAAAEKMQRASSVSRGVKRAEVKHDSARRNILTAMEKTKKRMEAKLHKIRASGLSLLRYVEQFRLEGGGSAKSEL